MSRPPGRAGRASAGGPPGRPRPLAVIAVAATALAVGAGAAEQIFAGGKVQPRGSLRVVAQPR